jgi:thioesterase domain-containing protein
MARASITGEIAQESPPGNSSRFMHAVVLPPDSAKLANNQVNGDVDYLVVRRAGESAGPAVVVVGLTNFMLDLESVLPPYVPVLWLQPEGFFAPPYLMRPFPEIAESYQQSVRRHQIERPLVLVGYSFSALIALELAARLGWSDQVEVLMIEPPLPGILPARAKPRVKPTKAYNSQKSESSPSMKAFRDRMAMMSRPDARNRTSKTLRAVAKSLFTRTYLAVQEGFLRGILESRARKGQRVPRWIRSWWFYLPQIHDRTLKYQVPRSMGRAHLAGRLDWLTANEPSWKVLMEGGELVVCPVPLAKSHDEVNLLPCSQPWIDLIFQWVNRQVPVPTTGDRVQDVNAHGGTAGE